MEHCHEADELFMPLRHSSVSSATMWARMLHIRAVASGASADSLRYAVFFALWIYLLPIGCGTGSAPHDGNGWSGWVWLRLLWRWFDPKLSFTKTVVNGRDGVDTRPSPRRARTTRCPPQR